MFEFLLQVLFSIPGAFIRWVFTGCKKPMKDHLFKGDGYIDSIIGISMFLLIGLLIRYFFF